MMLFLVCLCFTYIYLERYVGVGKDNQVELFYYFVESQRDSLADPLLLYLTGGPGTSGLYPLLYQFGKYYLIVWYTSTTIS